MKYLIIITSDLQKTNIKFFSVELVNAIRNNVNLSYTIFLYSDGVKNLLDNSLIEELAINKNNILYCRTSAISRNIVVKDKFSVETSLGELSEIISKYDRVIYL